MHVRIRKLTSTSKDEDLVLKLSKSSTIRELMKMIEKKLKIEMNKQKLYYRGKQLISEHTVADYNIRLNDVIQLQIIENIEKQLDIEKTNELKIETNSLFYQVGDQIDVIDKDLGAWFEAKILRIFKESKEPKEDELIFQIKMDRNIETTPYEVRFDTIRPRAQYFYKKSELKVGMIVFVNYNIEEPEMRGYWYDFEIKKITKREVRGNLLVGKSHTILENCKIKFLDEIMRIEKPQELEESNLRRTNIEMRKLPLYCLTCEDVASVACRDCGCNICTKKEQVGVLIICDECDLAYHLHCLQPPLAAIPSDPEWYCPDCKTNENEIVKAGEKLKVTKKAKKAQNWGKGMACVGRTTECTIVPKDHYGPIPGIDVGTCWKFRMQVSEAGIHRPHVAGIHGSEKDGAYSLILSGGYEDDLDLGEEFFYTGSGGRDLSGGRRVNEQSSDQKLTRMNKALALNCNVEFDNKVGGEASDWKRGKPVRVVRNYKLAKHSKFAPKEGNRYDGIYKVVRYFPEKGKSGFIVWRFLLRRDDPNPAPWAPGGKEFDIIYPSGYFEAEEVKNLKSKNKRGKSQLVDAQPSKKPKFEAFELSPQLQSLIDSDLENAKLWAECRGALDGGKLNFLAKVGEIFLCVCCQEIVFNSVTLPCKHNLCKSCLKRSFSAQIFVCPWCRYELGTDFQIRINAILNEALKLLFPGYEARRM